MEYFKSGLKSVLGNPPPGEQPSGADIVEKLVDRVDSSTLLEDRTDACRALKALSRKYRVEVGAHGMDALRQVLENDYSHAEIIGYALDTLCNITSPELLDEEENCDLNHDLSRVGEQFTEIFIKQPENVTMVLNFIEEFDFKVRWPAVRLLRSILSNKPKEIQDIVLVSPMGVSKLMDLLGDSREVIRNDVLLLLVQLTKGNANIQKIVAFENAFDRIFDVIQEEGYADGGIVVQDCLLLMLNLLRNNISNINFFKEGSYIQKLTPMFELPKESEEVENSWSSQRVVNTHSMLQIVRALVSPSNPTQVSSSCQKIMNSSLLLECLCNILMASGVPADVLTETINTVAEVIRGNFSNQEYFASVLAPSNPPRPALVVLLMSMVNEKQPFVLRCAVLYCFQCFMFKNEFGQSKLVQTLLPSSSEVTSLTSGQLLCGGLFSTDQMSNWFSAVALSHGIVENPVQKEQLLKVLLATNPGSPPVSLLQQCSLLLQQSNKVQSQIGLLMLLSMWLSHCPLAVSQFLSLPSNIPFLTSQVTSNEHDENEELVQGLCAFLMGICVHCNDNSVASFSQENLRQIIAKRIGLETFLDKLGQVSKHEQYSKAAKHPQIRPGLPNELLLDHEFCRLFKALEGLVGKAVSPKPELMNGADVPDSVLVLQYKDLIREQDCKLKDMSDELERLRNYEMSTKQQIEDLLNNILQLRDENVLLRAHANSNGSDVVTQLEFYKREADSWRKEFEKLREIHESEGRNKFATSSSSVESQEINELKLENEKYKQEIILIKEELDNEKLKLAAAEFRNVKLIETEEEFDKLKKDQQDLLELLTFQDVKLNEYKEKLRNLGENVDEEDEITNPD